MNPYNVSIRFDLDRERDRTALSWLSRSRGEGFKTNSDAVIEAINEYHSRRARLATDSYLETREKEDAFLRQVLETVRQGLRESSIGSLAGLMAVLQGAVPASNSSRSVEPADVGSLDTAFDFVDNL